MPKAEKKPEKTASAVRTHARKEGVWRYAVLAMLFLAVIGFYTVRLVSLQLTAQDGGILTIGGERVAVTQRIVTVRARRGSILDTNGTPLVQDILRYQMELDASAFPSDDAAANEVLAAILTLLDTTDGEIRSPSLPITPGFADGRYLYFLKPETVTADARARFEAFLTTVGLEGEDAADPDAIYTRYHLYEESDEETALLAGTEKTLLYEESLAFRIACIRYDLEVLTFDNANPYILTEDTDISLITPIREQRLRGVTFRVQTEREYCSPGYASHILGRTGKIQASDVEYYTSQGYPLDALVGIDGLEAAMEEVLRGTDGTMRIEEDAFGNILRQTVLTEAVPGRDVYLTIDINLQIRAEDALADNIAYIVESALSSGEPQSGEDALCSIRTTARFSHPPPIPPTI